MADDREFKHYHKNPRKINVKQREQLRQNLIDLGDISGIVHDEVSGEIIGGNQRSEVIDIENCDLRIFEEYDRPTRTGTTAIGLIIYEDEEGNKVELNYRRVHWTAAQCERANITANSLGGQWDWDMLKEEFDIDELVDWGGFEMEDFGIGEESVAEEELDTSDDFSLPSGDKAPFQQITFTLADSQAETVKHALELAKGDNNFKGFGNENSNGNAIYRIVCEWLEHKKGFTMLGDGESGFFVDETEDADDYE